MLHGLPSFAVRRSAAGLALLAALALPATALVADFPGTPGPDTLVGTDTGDVMHGLAGDDNLKGLAGAD